MLYNRTYKIGVFCTKYCTLKKSDTHSIYTYFIIIFIFMIHQIPTNDVIKHTLSLDCECQPYYVELDNGSFILAHNAMDLREECYELGIDHPNAWDYAHFDEDTGENMDDEDDDITLGLN